jgi:hypothetical protein
VKNVTARLLPFVAGHGLQDLQQAVNLQLKRVSAAKVVVTLAEPGNGARSE